MNDRSVQAAEIRQAVVVTGDCNAISLRFGDSGIMLPLKRKQFRPPERRSRLVLEERPRELDLLNPEAGKLPFVREDDLAQLRAWIDAETDISVHALIGRAGSGKTRLALQLCRAVDNDAPGKGEWIAGFISPRDMSAVAETLATHSFAWERRTLLVIDYAAQCHRALGRWLDRLVYHRLDTKLRILLLEREAPEGFGWFHELTVSSLRDQQARLSLFYARRPTLLPDLSGLEERRSLLAAALDAANALRCPPPSTARVPAAGTDADFDANLAHRQFGNPLSLVMAGIIARDRGPRAALAMRHLDAARKLGARELDRFAALAESCGLSGDTVRYIVALNGLAGGLPRNDLRKTLADELAASQRSANLDVLLSLLEQELHCDSETESVTQSLHLATIQPDLIGEAAIIEAFTGQPSKEDEGPAAVRRAYALNPEVAAPALIRLVQDFAYALEDSSATQTEKATARRVMNWLLTLALKTETPDQLIPLVSALPSETTILRKLAVGLTGRLAAHFRQEAERSKNPVDLANAAQWLVNVANRAFAYGQHKHALTMAQEGVRYYRVLAQVSPDYAIANLPIALSTLAAVRNASGGHRDALATAEEAAGLYRILAEALPDFFNPELAGSLNNLSIILSDLGRSEDALAAAEESVRLYRDQAETRSDIIAPNLALSLNTLAKMRSDCGRPKDALAAAEEAVRRYRSLAEVRPDAYTPGLAGSLNTLSNLLSDCGQPVGALAAAEEATRHHRVLAEARPEAFAPSLAGSLGTLAKRLRTLDRVEAALAAAEEAVRRYHALAEVSPDSSTVNLARSLWISGLLYYETGDPERAQSSLREGIELLVPTLGTAPGALHDIMGLVRSYVMICKAIGREPDEALIAPMLKVFEQLRKGDQS